MSSDGSTTRPCLRVGPKSVVGIESVRKHKKQPGSVKGYRNYKRYLQSESDLIDLELLAVERRFYLGVKCAFKVTGTSVIKTALYWQLCVL